MLALVEQKNEPAVGTEAVARTHREEPELCEGNERGGGLQADGPAAEPNRPNGNEKRRMKNEECGCGSDGNFLSRDCGREAFVGGCGPRK